MEGRAPARRVLDPAPATMDGSEPGDEREADSRARGEREDVRAAVEGLEDDLLELVGNAGPVIVDDEQQVAVGVSRRTSIGFRRGVLDRVDDEVLDDPLDLGAIHLGDDRMRRRRGAPVRRRG